jgi:hypothetical protein
MATDPRITKAKRIIASAAKTAGEIKTDGSLNRSTATRAIYKTKAEALGRGPQRECAAGAGGPTTRPAR